MSYKYVAAIIATSLGLSSAASAAHWQIVSVGLNSTLPYVVFGPASYGTPNQESVQINTGLYGTGTFTFYGQTMATSQSYGPSQNVTVNLLGSVGAYYTYVYKWISDSPSDIPPPPGHNLGVNGYHLDRINTESYEFSGDGGMGSACQWSAWFSDNASPLCSNLPNGGQAHAWPYTRTPIGGYFSPNSTNMVSFTTPAGTNLFDIEPVVIGEADITVTSGTTYATVQNALNDQSMTFGGTWQNSSHTFTVFAGGETEAYLGCTQIGGLPVKP